MHYTKFISSICFMSCAAVIPASYAEQTDRADQDAVNRIVNGDAVSIANYPSFASLYYDTLEFNNAYSQSPFCGAAILDPSHVITAGHCVEGDSSIQMFLTVVPQLQDEQDYPFGNIQRHRVAEIYYPDDFINAPEWLFANDIAVLKLETAMNIDAINDVINMPNNESYRRANAQFSAVGHGNTRSGADSTSLLLAASLEYVTNSLCGTVFLNGQRLTNKQICFDGDYSSSTQLKNSTCQGDSGGPVYWHSEMGEQVLVGLTSFGPGVCGNPDLPVTSVFTEVHDYRSWISSVMAGNETPKITITEQDRRDYFNNGGGTLVEGGDGDVAFSTTPDSSSGQITWLWVITLLGVLLRRRLR